MSDIWFMSDPHYGHKNIVRGVSSWSGDKCLRNFDSIEQMNDTIVNNINNVVGENDELFCLGDWNFGGTENIYNFRKRLNCKKIHLILGNHDNRHGYESNPQIKGTNLRASDCFHIYSPYHVLKKRGLPLIVLFHFPIASWDKMADGSIHLFGHCHSSREDRFFNGGKSMDVGLDGNNFKPYNLTEILEIASHLPVKHEGHH
jgi:calcineurin-like phosphoesterase family protein